MIKDKGYEIQINQQCVKEQKDSIISFYNKNDIKNNVFTFSNNILQMIASSDLAISRCGASTTAELVEMKISWRIETLLRNRNSVELSGV